MILGVSSLAFTLGKSGSGFINSLSIESLIRASVTRDSISDITQSEYSTRGMERIIQTLYFSGIPLAYCAYKQSRKIIYLTPYLFLLLISLFVSSRLTIIVNILIIIAIELIDKRGRLPLHLSSVAAGIFLVYFVFIAFARQGLFVLDDTSAVPIVDIILNYIAGSLAALNNIYPQYLDQHSWRFGLSNVIPALTKVQSFLGVSENINLLRYQAIEVGVSNMITNVYTTFNEVLLDFGVYGSLLFAFCHGFVTSLLTSSPIIKRDYLNGLAIISLLFNVFFTFYTIFSYLFVLVMPIHFWFFCRIDLSSVTNKSRVQ
jgi:oligosaccharide repeat unit polymerase